MRTSDDDRGVVLVTGGSGFIGQYICERLLQRETPVRVLDLMAPGFEVDFVKGDVRDGSAVRRAMQGVSEVVHLAAAHHDTGIDNETYFSVNVGGTRLVLDEMARVGAGTIRFTSSVAVYGTSVDPSERDTTLHPSNPYGQSKLEAEDVIRAWAESDSTREATMIRPAVVFGPRNYANMYTLIMAIDRGWYWPVGSGKNLKSVAFVDNLVDVVLYFMDRPEPGVRVFNYVDKPDLTSAQIAGAISRELGKTPRPRLPLSLAVAAASVAELVSAVLRRPLPLSRARVKKLAATETRFGREFLNGTDFHAAVEHEEGLRRMVRWYDQVGRGHREAPRIPPTEVPKHP